MVDNLSVSAELGGFLAGPRSQDAILNSEVGEGVQRAKLGTFQNIDGGTYLGKLVQ